MSKMTMSLLAEKQASGQMKSTVGGSLRPGIKVLTKAAMANPEIVKIYNQGVANLQSFDDIEKEICKKFPDVKNPMYPRNVEYFSVSAKKFPSIAAAKQFVEDFGEDRGDGVKRIYRVPVAFKSDNLEEIFPNTLQGFSDGSQHYMVIDESTGQHLCMYRKPIDSKLAKRGRVLPREFSIKGDCDPNNCAMYASGKCKFNASLEFYIPGTSLGLITMTTSSMYASQDIWAALLQAKQALGYLPALNPRTQKPVFWLTKVETERAFFDENGTRKTGKQWSPKLHAELDFAVGVANKQLLSMGQPSVQSLEAPTVDADGVIHSAKDRSDTIVDSNIAANSKPEQSNTQAQIIRQSNKEIFDEAIQNYGFTAATLDQFMNIAYGDGWQGLPNVDQAYETMLKVISKLGKQFEPFMKIRVISSQKKIVSAQFDDYAKVKFGKDWKEKSDAVLADLEDILRGGEDVAIAIIQEVGSKKQAA